MIPPDLDGFIGFAIFGMVCAALLVVLGIPLLGWELFSHLSISLH